MPTVLRAGPYSVVIHTREPGEPAHVHVHRDACEAKFWIDPVSLHGSRGFPPIELRRIARMLRPNAANLLERSNALHVRRPS